MTAAQLAAYRFAPEMPDVPAARGTAQAALLSLLLHGAAVTAIAAVALQPQAPQGEAVFTIELVTSATAATGSPQAAAEPIAAEAAEAAPPAETAEAPPEPVQELKPEPPVQTALAEPDAVPLPPEPAADITVAPLPEAKPQTRPRPPVQAVAEAKPATPPAAAPAAQPHSEATSEPATPPSQPAGQLGAERQVASAPAGSSDVLPVITEPRFRAPPQPPDYPPRARAMEQQGVSVVRALVDTDGTSREIRLWRSSGFDVLDRAALVAVRGWRFEAARRGEQPVLAWVEIPIRFEIR